MTDVAIIGGGPAGATVGCLLKTYAPDLGVTILERETFPRDHVGESLLPPISPLLVEMGVWDAVEAAEFPIKIGATYRWGRNPERWDFEFFPAERFVDEPRPAPFAGQRTMTAFQVDRARYDQILLDRAAELGCEVRQNAKVSRVIREGHRVAGLALDSGQMVTARHYVDASGSSGTLRRAMGVPTDSPTTLRNVAVWDYWQNAEWAVEIGVGGTRIQVLTVGYGWIWFIPLGPTRTSIGLVVPAAYLKASGKHPEDLYLQALGEEPMLQELLRHATCEGRLATTKDWSFLARRHAGENWFLVGDAAGFADPILSAGVTMAQVGAQQLAYTLLEIKRGKLDAAWLKAQFEARQKGRIATHIRFGDYWYTANAQFNELQEFTAQLASDVGLEMTPERAWAWIAQGGFIDEDLSIGMGGFGLATLRGTSDFLLELEGRSPLEENNFLRLDLRGASWKETAVYHAGRVEKAPCYVRGDRVLPVYAQIELLVNVLQNESRLPAIMALLERAAERQPEVAALLPTVPEALEAMIRDGWILASHDPSLPLGRLVAQGRGFRPNRDSQLAS